MRRMPWKTGWKGWAHEAVRLCLAVAKCDPPTDPWACRFLRECGLAAVRLAGDKTRPRFAPGREFVGQDEAGAVCLY